MRRTKSQLFKKKQYPNFKKMSPRGGGPNSKLPSYMQKIHSRLAAEMTTEKQLKLMQYSRIKFFDPKSSFKKVKRKRELVRYYPPMPGLKLNFTELI